MYGRGMMLDDDPFNAAFGGARTAPATALDLDVEEEAPRSSPLPDPEPSSEEKRARAIRELAQYGPAPRKWFEEPMYWFRVLNRRRVLAEELLALSAQRKRTDDEAQEGLSALGDALDTLRDDPRLASLARLFHAVEEAEYAVGSAAAAGERQRGDVTSELARLTKELQRAEQQAAPLREREAQLGKRVEELRARASAADARRRKAEAELEAMRSGRVQAPAERWGAVSAEHEARLSECQTLGVELRPLEDDLGNLRRELSARMRKITSLNHEKRSKAGALERAQQNSRVSVGSARGAYQQSLLALANAALKAGLHELVPEQAALVSQAAERAEKKRQQEELHRAATYSYDAGAYQRGFTMLLGASVGSFVLLLIALFF
jgi:chromosome segregation ATPase